MRSPLRLIAAQALIFICLSLTSFSSSASGWLFTRGASIYNPDGTPFLAHGVNLPDMRSNNACFNGYNANEVIRRLDVVASWGANLIRIPLQADNGGNGNSDILFQRSYLPAIQQIIDYATLTYPNMYIMLSLWKDPTIDTQGDPTAATNPVYKALVDTFYSYPNIIFGVINEPEYDTDPNIWSAMNSAVQTIRVQELSHNGPPHIISVQGRSFDSNINYYLTHPITAGNGLNIAYEAHIYGSSYTDAILAASANIPVIIGEYGPADTNNANHYDWAIAYSGKGQENYSLDQTAALAATCRRLKIPFLAWAFNECDSPSMLIAVGGTPCRCNPNVIFKNTTWGNQVQTELQNPYGATAVQTSDPNRVSATASTLSASPPFVVADGNAKITIQLSLKSLNGNYASAQNVSLAIDGGNNTLSTKSGVTDANGIFQALVSSTKPEIKTITVIAGPIKKSVSVTFTSLQPNSIQISSSPNTIPSDGYSVSSIYVTAKRFSGVPLSNTNILLTSTGTNDSLQWTQPLDANGQAQGSLHATVPSNDTITASVGLDSASTAVTTTPAYYIGAEANPNNAPADGNSKIWVTVSLRTGAGAPGINQSVNISCPQLDASQQSAMGGQTDSEGKFYFSVFSNKVADTFCYYSWPFSQFPNTINISFTPVGQGNYTLPQRNLLTFSATPQKPNASAQRVQAAILD